MTCNRLLQHLSRKQKVHSEKGMTDVILVYAKAKKRKRKKKKINENVFVTDDKCDLFKCTNKDFQYLF